MKFTFLFLNLAKFTFLFLKVTVGAAGGWSIGLGNIHTKNKKKFDCFPNTKFWEVIWKYFINKKNFGVLLRGKNATKPALLRKETNYIHFPEMRLSQDISVKTSLFCRKLFRRGETKHETKKLPPFLHFHSRLWGFSFVYCSFSLISAVNCPLAEKLYLSLFVRSFVPLW